MFSITFSMNFLKEFFCFLHPLRHEVPGFFLFSGDFFLLMRMLSTILEEPYDKKLMYPSIKIIFSLNFDRDMKKNLFSMLRRKNVLKANSLKLPPFTIIPYHNRQHIGKTQKNT
jgi:hypothetical protein